MFLICFPLGISYYNKQTNVYLHFIPTVEIKNCFLPLFIFRIRGFDLKNNDNVEIELCSLLWEFVGLQAWGTASQVTQRSAPRRQGEEPGYIKVLQQRADSLNIKKLLLLKENQIYQLKEFTAFLYMGRYKSLG